jgi:MFS family permease
MFAQYRQVSRNTFILSMTVGLVLTAYFAWWPLLALHLRDLGANDLQLGVSFSIFTLAHALPALLGGVLADRFGRKWVFAGPGILLTPLYILAGLTSDWLVLTIILIFTNFLGALQWPAMQAFMSESDEAHRAAAFSLMEVFVLGAAIAGPLFGSFLLGSLGVSGLIILHAILLVPATWARIFLLQETHHASQRSPLKRAALRRMVTPAAFWIIAANALFWLTLGLSFEGPFSALLANDVWGLDEQQIQWLNSLGAGVALIGIWLGSRADTWGGRRVWILSALGFAIALVGWGFSPSWQFGLVFFLVAHIFYETIFIMSEVMLAQHSTRATRSSVFGLMTTVGGFSHAVGPTLGAWAASVTSLAAPFVLAAASQVASVFLIARITDAPEADSGEIMPEEFVAAQLLD